MILHVSPEYAKYSSDEEDEDDAVLGEPFVKEREIDEQEIDKVLIVIHYLLGNASQLPAALS